MGTETWALEPGGLEHGERVVNADRTGMSSPDGRSAVGVDHICSERLKVAEVGRDVTHVQFQPQENRDALVPISRTRIWTWVTGGRRGRLGPMKAWLDPFVRRARSPLVRLIGP
jgi:hypothetical protein